MPSVYHKILIMKTTQYSFESTCHNDTERIYPLKAILISTKKEPGFCMSLSFQE